MPPVSELLNDREPTFSPAYIENLSILLIIIPAVLILVGIVYAFYRFGQPSEEDPSESLPETDEDEHARLLQESPRLIREKSLERVLVEEPWRAIAPVSSTSRASRYPASPPPRPSAPPKQKPVIGSRAAKAEAASRDKILEELSREEKADITRSLSRNGRKDD